MRIDCGYSFCDKTRFVQHTARHERLDTLMGGDFQQFRANVHCGRPDCVYATTMPSTNVRGKYGHTFFSKITIKYVKMQSELTNCEAIAL
jgi:hypothetical protein